MDEIIKIAKGVYRHFAIVAAEFFDLPQITKENIHQWVDVEGIENYQAAVAKGKGVLSIVAHFGNWELMTIAVPMFLKPMDIVYRPLDNPVIDNMVEYVRTMNGNELIPKGGSGHQHRWPRRDCQRAPIWPRGPRSLVLRVSAAVWGRTSIFPKGRRGHRCRR